MILRHGLALWRARWSLARLALAVLLLWVVVADSPARLARLQLASLPDFDYLAQIESLRSAGRFGEAIVVADAGLAATSGPTQQSVLAARQRVETEQASWARRFKDAAAGAVTGGVGEGRGGEASLETLIGAVAADFFIVGDIRDLIIQGFRFVRDDEPDAVIAALSAIGLATTLAPEIDWAPSLLKAAKKAGSLSKGLGDFFISAAKARDFKRAEAVLTDTAAIAAKASPAGAIHLLKHADSPEDVAAIARFVDRRGAPGAFALRSADRAGVELLARAADPDAAGMVLIAASKKGPAGAVLLKRGLLRPLLRPHPLVGLAKNLWKGRASDLVRAALDRLDPAAWWVLPALAAWVVLEAAMLLGRFVPRATGGGRSGVGEYSRAVAPA